MNQIHENILAFFPLYYPFIREQANGLVRGAKKTKPKFERRMELVFDCFYRKSYMNSKNST